MSYDIKPFDPENAEYIIDKQVSIGKTILGKWRNANQTETNRLKRQYTSDEFDPSTRLYAYKNDEIVGFITSNIIDQEDEETKMARIEIPIVPKEHEEARELLLKEALNVLKDKNVEIARTRAGPGWGYTLDYVNKFNFEKSEQMSRYSEFNPVDLDHELIQDVDEIIQYDENNHRKLLSEAFKQHYNIDDEEIINDALDQLVDGRLIVHYHGILIENDKIIGRLLAYASPDDPGPVILGSPLILTDNDELRNSIGLQLIGDALYTLSEQEQFDIRQSLFNNSMDLQPLFEQFGIEYKDDLAYYDKNLTE